MELLDHFNWGPSFIEINLQALNLYSSKGINDMEVKKLEDEYIEMAKDNLKSKNRIDYFNVPESNHIV